MLVASSLSSGAEQNFSQSLFHTRSGFFLAVPPLYFSQGGGIPRYTPLPFVANMRSPVLLVSLFVVRRTRAGALLLLYFMGCDMHRTNAHDSRPRHTSMPGVAYSYEGTTTYSTHSYDRERECENIENRDLFGQRVLRSNLFDKKNDVTKNFLNNRRRR